MDTTTNRQALGMVAALALLLPSCGSDAAPRATTVPETMSTVAATTTPTPTTTTTSMPDEGVTVIKDIVYLTTGDNEYPMDIYTPPGEGPWPVVVAFHGATVFKNHPTNTLVAKAAAEAGVLVFAPNWEVDWPDGLAGLNIGVEEMDRWDAATRCALAFAQQEATTYGGDPNRTVIYGLSGGASVSFGLLLNPTAGLAAGCMSQTLPGAPVGAVLGDAEYFNHSRFFDRGFEADAAGVRARGADVLDPASWPADMSARFRLWAAESDSFVRRVDDPWNEDGWLAQRDPDGTIRVDLDALGELDDGTISHRDEGLLLATRLQRAGIDATFDSYPGGHGVADKVPELVAYILDVAGMS